jgi:RHS repeat-associated protein
MSTETTIATLRPLSRRRSQADAPAFFARGKDREPRRLARTFVWLSTPRHAAMLLALTAVLSLSALLAASASAVPLSEAETAHMSEIVKWVYHNSGLEEPPACGVTCEALESAEHSDASLTTESASEFEEQLGDLEIEAGLWGSLSSLSSQIGVLTLASTPARVGWEISGPVGHAHQKWIEIVGPSAPPAGEPPKYCESGGWRADVRLAGETVGSSYYEKLVAGANGWYLLGCNELGEDVEDYVKQVLLPDGMCKSVYFNPPTFAGWARQEFMWNKCGEEFGAHVPEVDQFASAYFAPLRLGPPQPWTHQHLEGPATVNAETNTASDPGEAAVTADVKAELERGKALDSWVEWVLDHSPSEKDPLRTVPAETFGTKRAATPQQRACTKGDPVNCATGNETESQQDLAVGGRGPAFELQRTYNSQLARAQTSPGPFGYGWTSSYSAHLEVNEELSLATVYQDDGSTVRFVRSGSGWAPLGSIVQASLSQEGSTYMYTLPDQTKLHFNGEGLLTSEEDRNGNALTMSHGTGGRLEAVTDPAGRKITLKYNGEGRVESAADPMGHTVKYGYEGGNLASVTEPGEASPNWQFKYDSSHELTTETLGRGQSVTTEYDGSGRVTAQTDPRGNKRKWEYVGSESTPETKITEPNGSKTVEKFNVLGEPTSVTRASGTAEASSTGYEYNAAGYQVATIDPDGHETSYEYDAAGNRTGQTDADGNTTQWTYDSTHDVETETTPNLETTTIERDAHGNPVKISRPAPGEATQTTKCKYDSHGDLESTEDPLKRTTKYEYDSYGDRTAEIDPEGDKRTWGYNEDSQVTSTVSPRGHVTGAKESKYTTTIERDARGRTVKTTDPLKHETKYAYDADGNLETETDPIGNLTRYSYDEDDEPTKTREPSGQTSETEYDSEGQVESQTDGNGHTTKYAHNALGEVTEVVDPLSRKTTKEYDAAGNLVKLIDPAKRTTTYKYDLANRLVEVSYSDGKTPTVKYEYDADGNRTKMVDGTGTSEYHYDQLDRLTESKDGHGDKVAYEYDLANEPTKIVYPGEKAVTRAYDKAGRLESVTDWLEHTTKFGYDADSDQTSTTFPTSTGDVDSYAYETDDAMEEVKMKKGSETLASIEYARSKDDLVTKATSKGLPGEEKPAFTYDENSRLTKGAGIAYKYDSANNPTKIGSSTDSYDVADELEKGTGVTYSYDEVGERTKAKPTSGPATTYGYDQAGNLTSVARPHEGEVATIEDSYGYDGNGLRASQTISGTTGYLTWDIAEGLPLILNDGTYSFIYGPADTPIEQIDAEGHVFYLHHDQQGSTRMLTGSSGTKEASVTYDAFGNRLGSTGSATTPLGYDGQYTSADTGLIYLRARTYDPATAQFLSVDPVAAITGIPYSYSGDNPVNAEDPSGLLCFDPTGTLCPIEHKIAQGVEHAVNRITFGLIGPSSVPCTTASQVGEDLTLIGSLFVPGEDEIDAAEILSNPDMVRDLTPAQVDDLARSAEYDIKPGGESYDNPATRYYVPGTNESEGFRVLPEGVAGQPGLKGGPYLRYFGGPNDNVGVPLGGG